MADIYVIWNEDHHGDGSDWSEAWDGKTAGKELQDALDTVVAGETVHLASKDDAVITGAFGTPFDIDVNSGIPTSRVRLVGYAYNGGVTPLNNGHRVVFNAFGQADATVCFKGDNTDNWNLENIEAQNGTTRNFHGVNAPDKWLFINCKSTNSGDDGFGHGELWSPKCIGCVAENATVYGFDTVGCFFCRSDLNTQHGFRLCDSYYCSAVNNTLSGYFQSYGVQSIAHNNGEDGFYFQNALTYYAVLCRATDNFSEGFTKGALALYCHASGNGGLGDFEAGVLTEYPSGVDTRDTAGPAGYRDVAGGDFSTRIGAALYRSHIPFADDVHDLFACAGLPASWLPRLIHGER